MIGKCVCLISLKTLIAGVLSATLLGAVAVGIHDARKIPSSLNTSTAGVSIRATTHVEAPYHDPKAGMNVGNQEEGSEPRSTPQSVVARVTEQPWTFFQGRVISIDNSIMTVQTEENVLDVQMGPLGFWQSQGVSIQAGDDVLLTGFLLADQFLPLIIEKTADGQRVLLRDPNGNPLWGGPGRGGRQGGQGNTGADSAGGTGMTAKGQGRMFRGGR